MWHLVDAYSTAQGRYNGTYDNTYEFVLSHAMCAFPFYHYRGKRTEPRKHGVKDKDGGSLWNKDEDEEEERVEDELEVRSSKLHSDLAYVQLHPEVRYASRSETSIYFSHLIDMI